MLFLDAHVDGLRLCAHAVEAVPAEESHIVRFVRTPEGSGVGVVRENGGEAWRVVANGSRLIRSGKWPTADHIVVLDGGNLYNSLPLLSPTEFNPRAKLCNVLGRGWVLDPQFHARLRITTSTYQLPIFAAFERRARSHRRDNT